MNSYDMEQYDMDTLGDLGDDDTSDPHIDGYIKGYLSAFYDIIVHRDTDYDEYDLRIYNESFVIGREHGYQDRHHGLCRPNFTPPSFINYDYYEDYQDAKIINIY